MLSISPQTSGALRRYAWPAFCERLRERLADDYPHFLPCFPLGVQQQIVGNMLERALAWQLTLQSSLHAFCELMIRLAPNFDRVPGIADNMRRLGPQLDRKLDELASSVPASLVEEARAGASTLPLFTPAALDQAPPAERTAAAIRLALGDRPEAAGATTAAAEAVALAEALGLAARADAPLVLTACRSFWGAGFLDLPWAAALRRERWTAAEQVELLRLRLAMQFGRFL